MTKRPSPPAQGLTVLTASDVDKVLSTLNVEAALDIQSRVFKSYSAQHTATHADILSIQAPQRIVTTTEDATMLFMPSRAADAGGTAIKIVSVPSGGRAEGLPATTLVMDETTGRVRGVVNARKLTALRNACGSALSYRILYPEGKPTSLIVFGSGAQADAHIRLFIQLWPSITQVTLIARRPTPRSASLITSLMHAFPSVTFKFGVHDPSSPTTSPNEHAVDVPKVLGDASIIVTCTPSTEPLFDGTLVGKGAHLVLIGSYKPHMREIDDGLVKRAGVVLVDSTEACRAEAGELIRADIGEDGMVELGQALVSPEDVKRVVNSGDVTLFKSVGIGIQDVAVAALVLEQAQQAGLGTVIPDYDTAA